MITVQSTPLLIVVSAPSGTGKTTLCDRLLAEFDTVAYSVSCTTRPPRDGEEDGRNYHFLSDAAFEQRAARGDFLEQAEVHGHRYGTLKQDVRAAMAGGRDVLMDIDVQGAEQVRRFAAGGADNEWVRTAYVDVFILPPSLASLEGRLTRRGLDADAVIARRMQRAEAELARWSDYRYVIVNDQLDRAYEALRAVFLAERHRVGHRSVTIPHRAGD
jgi:guanylate kinase